MQKGWLTKTFKGDRVIWALVVVFMIYSLLAVYSSSVSVAYLKHGGNTAYFLRSQFFMLLLSLIIIVVVHYLPYRIYYSMSGLILLFSIGLLILTFAIGARVNEAVRAIEIPGTGFRLQTSDVAKVALVLYLARALSQFQGELNNFMVVTKYFMFPVAVICALIMPENLSTALMVFGICMIIMFIGRVPFKFLLAYVGIAVVGVVMFALVLSMVSKQNRVEVWKNRVENFFSGKEDPDADYQSNQAKIAISTGGLIRESSRKKYTEEYAATVQFRFHFCDNNRRIRIIIRSYTSDTCLYDIALQGNNYCKKMRNSLSCLSGHGTYRNDNGPGNA